MIKITARELLEDMKETALSLVMKVQVGHNMPRQEALRMVALAANILKDELISRAEGKMADKEGE